MRESLLKNTVKTCCAIFCLLIAVHAFEAVVLRMDETFFGENFINKLFGIFILWLKQAVRHLHPLADPEDDAVEMA